MAQTRYRQLIRFGLLGTLWGAMAMLVLNIKDLRGEWDHAVCGPWGCSPPVAAVISCQGIWAMIFLPVVAFTRQSFSRRIQRITGTTFLVVALLVFVSISIYEYFHWYQAVSDSMHKYFGHRIALSTLTFVDIPIVILLLSGLYLRWRAAMLPARKKETDENLQASS